VAIDILSAYAGMVAAAMTPIPTEVAALAIALRFSFWLAIAIIWVGAMTGAFACHLLASRLGAGGTAWLLRRTSVRRARDRLAGTGWLGIFGLRLIPLVPYFALSVAAGLLRLPLVPFLSGTALGILPATFTITALGAGLIARDAGTIIAGALALTALVLLGVLFRKRARDGLR
jgi:uncharacterized membrane protein YdjX (TVP38/TMEM64 family)